MHRRAKKKEKRTWNGGGKVREKQDWRKKYEVHEGSRRKRNENQYLAISTKKAKKIKYRKNYYCPTTHRVRRPTVRK